MTWFSILKKFKTNKFLYSDNTNRLTGKELYFSNEDLDNELHNRKDFLKIISNNAELEKPEIQQRLTEAENELSNLETTMTEMDKQYQEQLSKLETKKANMKSNKGITRWVEIIRDFSQKYKEQLQVLKKVLSNLESAKSKAENDLTTYDRYNQSGEEFIKMAKEYGWNLPDELDSFLRTLDVVYGVTPEAIEGIVGLMPQKTQEKDAKGWKDGVRRTDIPMQGKEKIIQVVQQLISRGIAPKDITRYTIHDELGIDHKDLGSKWNTKDDEALKEVIEMRSKSYKPMSEAERKWRGL